MPQEDAPAPLAEPEPRIIGLTGGIGSGKSTVAQFIEKMGYPVYSSDNRAKELVVESEDLRAKITALFGPQAYDEKGAYHRSYISSRVFDDPALLEKLNQIIHPAVGEDFKKWVKRQTTSLVFKETALLFELGLHHECFRSVLVTAEDNLRIKRVMDRDRKTYREVESIIDQQMPEKDKIRKTPYVIYNNNGLDSLEKETSEVIEKLLEEI